MAITLDRSSIVPTNDTGTPANPAGDGTLINATFFNAIYSEIDRLFNGSVADPFVLGSKFQVDGFGTHTFSAGGTGANEISIRNTSAGTGNLAGYKIGNNSTANLGVLWGFSSTYTSAGLYNASGVTIEATGAGGLTVAASDAAGYIRFHSGGAAERMRITPSGRLGIGTTAPVGQLSIVGNSFVAHGAAIGALSSGELAVNGGGAAPDWAQFVWGDGTGHKLHFGTRSSGNFTSRVQMLDTGPVLFSDGTAGAPALSFISDTDTGFYRLSADAIGVAAAGSLVMTLARGATSVGTLVGGAFGAGAEGARLNVQANTSGGGAPGLLVLSDKASAIRPIWVDTSGNVRTHSSTPSETTGDTIGTVVGTQTSLRVTKRQIDAFTDTFGALNLIRRTPLYRFKYRAYDPDTQHVGILADESPEFTRFGGTTFDPINAFGFSAAAIQALATQYDAMAERLARLEATR